MNYTLAFVYPECTMIDRKEIKGRIFFGEENNNFIASNAY